MTFQASRKGELCASLCGKRSGSHTKVVGELNPAVLHLQKWCTPTCGELGIPEFFCHRLHTSMTRATVEDSTAGAGQHSVAERPRVGLSCQDILGCVSGPGTQAAGRYSSLESLRHVSLALESANDLRPARPGVQCGEQRRPDLKHIKKKRQT